MRLKDSICPKCNSKGQMFHERLIGVYGDAPDEVCLSCGYRKVTIAIDDVPLEEAKSEQAIPQGKQRRRTAHHRLTPQSNRGRPKVPIDERRRRSQHHKPKCICYDCKCVREYDTGTANLSGRRD